MADAPIPLATAAQFEQGAFADLVRGYSANALSEIMIEATREVEGRCDRRLAPFAITDESHRAEGIDPDEYADGGNLPLDVFGALGRSYALALGASTLVRQCWLNEFAVRHSEYWQYSDVAVRVVRSYGGSQPVTQILSGPDVDSGHLWFNLGLFLPIGSRIYISYGGGYQTVPGDLVRAAKYTAAAIVVDELDPVGRSATGHDPGELRAKAEDLLLPYMRG
jgi:hypothetical protein